MAKGSTSKLLDNIKWFAALAVFSAAVIGKNCNLDSIENQFLNF